MEDMLFGRLFLTGAFHTAWAQAPQIAIDSYFGWQIYLGECHNAILVDDGTLTILFQDPPDCAGDPPPHQQCYCPVPDWADLASAPRLYELEWAPTKVTLTISDRRGNVLQTLTAPSAECPCPNGFRVPGVPMRIDINCNLDNQLPGEHTLEIDALTTSDCFSGPEHLCLGAGGRFKVEVHWRTMDDSGAGQAVPLTADSGYFWFFSSANIEIVVKLLNGCLLNDRFWFFAAGLTNVEVELTVTDTLTGEVITFTNPLGSPLLPILETSAFATCPSVTGSWKSAFEVQAKPRDWRLDVLDPTIQLRSGDLVSIKASGQWSVGLGNVGPDGGVGSCAGCPVDAAPGALIGRIGQGSPFLVGSGTTFRADVDGTLFLGANDNAEGACDGQNAGSCYDDNGGSLAVDLTIRRY